MLEAIQLDIISMPLHTQTKHDIVRTHACVTNKQRVNWKQSLIPFK